MATAAPTRPTSAVPATGIALVAALSLLWGMNFPSIKIALAELPPWTFRTACVATGGLGLLAIGRFFMGHPFTVPRTQRRALLIAALFNVTIWQICSALGVMRMEAGRAVIIAYTMPLWAVMLARLILRDPITPGRLAGLLFGLGGLLVLIGPDLQALGAAPAGAAFMLAAAISWAIGTIAVKRSAWTLPTIMLTGWQLTLGGIPVLAGMLILEPLPDFAALSGKTWAGFLYSAIVPMIVCHYIWFSLVKMLPAPVAAISTLAIPVIGVYGGWLLLDETVGWRELTALALVVAALAIVLVLPSVAQRLRSGRRSPSASHDIPGTQTDNAEDIIRSRSL